MSNLRYTADLLTDALFRANEPTDGSSDYAAQALVFLNNVYMQICRGGSELTPGVNEDWSWLHKDKPGVLTLRPALTGTCTVTQDSTTVTLDLTQTTDLVEYYFRIDTHPDIFRVETHGGGVNVVLDAVYTGDNATAAPYTVFALEYNLATDVMRITAPLSCYVASVSGSSWGTYRICRVAPAELSVWEATNGDSGIPDKFAEIGPVTAGVKRIRMNRYLGSEYPNLVRVEYEYLYRPTELTLPGSTEEPVLPQEWRHLLSDFTLAFLFGQKNDDRASAASQFAMAGLMGMVQENRYRMTTATRDLFRIKSRLQGVRGPLRTESGHIIG